MTNIVANIVKTYYGKGLIKAECLRYCRDKYLCADLVQEVSLILLDKPEELIQELNEKGELLFFIRKIAKNQFCSKTSPFWEQYKRFDEINDEIKDEKEI